MSSRRLISSGSAASSLLPLAPIDRGGWNDRSPSLQRQGVGRGRGGLTLDLRRPGGRWFGWNDGGCGVRSSRVAQTASAHIAEVRLSAVDRMAAGTLHLQRGAAHITEVSVGRGTGPTRRHEPVRNATVLFVHGRDPLLARFHEEARPPVLAPAPFALLGALRPLFSVAQDGDAARLNTLGHQMVHRGLRPLLPQIDVEVILSARGPSTVAVALDEEKKLWMGAQPRGVRVQ